MYKVFGISVADVGLRGAADLVQASLRLPGQQLVVTANPEILVYAHQARVYREILKHAGLVVPDGIGVVLASYLGLKPIRLGRVTGVELTELLVKESNLKNYSVYFVGGDYDTLQKATHYLVDKYGKINISGYFVGPRLSPKDSFPLAGDVNQALVDDILLKKPDIIFVGFGHPKQELWFNYYLPRLVGVKVGIGVGGAFDYFSGKICRAPNWLRMLGLEWLWRLLADPGRLSRILVAVLVFPALVLLDGIKNLFHVEQS